MELMRHRQLLFFSLYVTGTSMIELGLCFDTESSNTGNKAGRTPHDGKDCIMQSVVRVKN